MIGLKRLEGGIRNPGQLWTTEEPRAYESIWPLIRQ